MDSILILIQNQLSATIQIRSRHGRHSGTHSFSLKFIIQHTFLDGIYKPISNKVLSLLQMASLSPFPQLHIVERKFTGTLVSNHLSPSSHERKNSPIYLFRLKKIEQGQLLYPKIFPLIYQDFSHKTSWTQDRIKVCSAQDTSSCTDNPKLGFEFAQGFLDYQCFILLQTSLWTPKITHDKF